MFAIEAAALAKCAHCDDVAFDLRDGTYAIVHLTWSRQPESPPWPRFTQVASEVDLRAAMSEHGADF